MHETLPSTAFGRRWPAFSWTAPQPPISQHHRGYLEYYSLNFVTSGQAAEYRFGNLDVAPFRIAVQMWHPPTPPKGTVVIVHGYWDHSGLFSHLIERCLATGFTALIFDEPGHGLSSGESAAIDDFAQYVAVLQAVLDQQPQPAPPTIGIGQSTGGAVLLGHFFHPNYALDDTILLAPLIRAQRWPWLVFGHSLLSPVMGKFPRNMSVCGSHDPEYARFLKADPLQYRYANGRWISAMRHWAKEFIGYQPKPGKMLYIQGEQDDTVDWRYNLPQVQARVPDLQIERLPGAFHNLINEAKQYREPTLDLITRRLLDTVEQRQ